jgi:hypothetical protein
MTNPRTVNQALDELVELDGKAAEIEGILVVESEGYHLLHYPKAERRPGPTDGKIQYQPGIWLSFGTGSVQPNHVALSRWLGKRVRVHGLVRTIASLPDAGSLGRGGFGPWGFWPAPHLEGPNFRDCACRDQ